MELQTAISVANGLKKRGYSPLVTYNLVSLTYDVVLLENGETKFTFITCLEDLMSFLETNEFNDN